MALVMLFPLPVPCHDCGRPADPVLCGARSRGWSAAQTPRPRFTNPDRRAA